jgi:hypothetical protein
MSGAMVSGVRRRLSAVEYRKVWAWALAGLATSALVSSVTLAIVSESSDEDRDALRAVVDDQEDQLHELQRKLDCRYNLGADVTSIQADIFVTTALALAAAGRAESDAVRLYTQHLEQLAKELDQASILRADAVSICDTDPPR